MTTTKHIVAYIIEPPKQVDPHILFSKNSVNIQEKRIKDFQASNHPCSLLKTFVESYDKQRHRQHWPALEEAISYCLENRADLVISEIRNLTNNENFSKLILSFITNDSDYTPELHCCDQPFITKDNFVAIFEHSKQQKKLHAQLIRAGLSRTTLKSGNPQALEVLSKVNRPKIDNAIVFALMLQPVITEYRSQGHSQRKILQLLNEQGFTAPEGGPWVLSQLQKVLERMRLNELALTLEKRFIEYHAKEFDNATIAKSLNKTGIPWQDGSPWTSEAVIEVNERIKQIHDIIRFNEFIIELMPILEKYHVEELTEDVFANELQIAGIAVPMQPQA